nr:prepilin peptidase [Phenylobacterium aquaticum]
MEFIVHGTLLALLAGCIFSDVRTRRIPNFACAGIALLGTAECLLDEPRDLPIRLAIAGGAMFAGLVLHRKKVLGGGDIKLVASLVIWLTPIELRLFVLVILIAGGFVGIFYMGMGLLKRLFDPKAPVVSNVPYALAIVVGFLFLRPRLVTELFWIGRG